MNLVKIASKVASSMESIYVAIYTPPGASEVEAVEHARKLIPSKTGEWMLVDDGKNWYSGNLECEKGYYDSSEDYVKLGPDEQGYSVEWEKP